MKLGRPLGSLSCSLALAVAVTGCASSGAVPRPFPGAPRPPSATPAPPDAPAASSATAPAPAAIVRDALGLLGTPYRDGGDTPAGFDCSGFTRYVFGLSSIPLPRAVHDQFRVGTSLALTHSQPGDLIFFTTVAPGASHVGVVLDEDRFIHAPSTSGVVRIESFTQPYWRRRVVGVRRIP